MPTTGMCDMRDGSVLESLLRAREETFRAMELGENEIQYRGWWITIEDDERGWTYLFDGYRQGEPLEAIFEEIDRHSGSTEREIEALGEAWDTRLEVRLDHWPRSDAGG